MVKKLMLVLVALTVGCASVGCETTAPNPSAGDCKEFDYKTVGPKGEMRCKMLWCQGVTGGFGGGRPSGGVTTLWCEETK